MDAAIDDLDSVKCLLCTKLFNPNEPPLLQHLLLEHKFIISDVTQVSNLKLYINYWRKRFQQHPFEEFCTKAKIDLSRTGGQAVNEQFYLLCDTLSEDKELRHCLQKKKLEEILEQQQQEREDQNFKRDCLFCKKEFIGNRTSLFNHMTYDHNFSIGQPDNIVFGDELLQLLEDKLLSLQCLYCEKVFKNWIALKEHMRKKQHKRIRPSNTIYDKFYVINYLELGKNWETIQNETDTYNNGETNGASDDDWDGWDGPCSEALCLFCSKTYTTYTDILSHMKAEHSFDFEAMKKDCHMTYYHQVRLVNYIRNMVEKDRCISCTTKFTTNESLNEHMKTSGHIKECSRDQWDQDIYYTPTLEDDAFLIMLDSDEDETNGDTNSIPVKVVPEEDKFQGILDLPHEIYESVKNDY